VKVATWIGSVTVAASGAAVRLPTISAAWRADLGKQDGYKPTKIADRKEAWDPLL
jgi:hypothetical protein